MSSPKAQQGGDGVSILEFEKDKRKEIPKLAEELKAGSWKPRLYMEIEVAKKKSLDEISDIKKKEPVKIVVI